jgi:hypothetical protein
MTNLEIAVRVLLFASRHTALRAYGERKGAMPIMKDTIGSLALLMTAHISSATLIG